MMIEVDPADAGPGALLLFRMAPTVIAKHVGILTTSELFLHAYERLGVIEESLTLAWRRRIAFAFQFLRATGEGVYSRSPADWPSSSSASRSVGVPNDRSPAATASPATAMPLRSIAASSSEKKSVWTSPSRVVR